MRPGFGTVPVIWRLEPGARALALKAKSREAGQVEDTGGVAHRQALIANARAATVRRG